MLTYYQVISKVRIKNERNDNNKKRVYAVIILALFNFIFLGTEYLFDNMMKYVTDSKGVVIAQSYILGASVLGFIIFPFIKGCVKSKVPYIGSILAVAGYIAVY